MSEFKLISPMLDNFAMGDSINEHDGVYCCPAMENNSEDKYIVKIISTPASQTKLDALLLSGACADNDSALEYFRSITDGIIEEAQALEKLSQLEGFLPFEKWQYEPMDEGLGYNLYLLSRYHRTLQKQLKKSPMTHLGALNLGLDLCAALAVCRRLGYLYVNLKPSNIYLTAENEYRIGDLGFIKLESLKYASLPERYHSVYTAPEVTDAYSTLNATMDVYALGLILYQIFNDGALPSVPEDAETPQLPPPTYADYEMSEIILKACASNPDDRWQDPIQMGQALVSYMQRNGAHDTPIIPQVVTAEVEDPEEDTGAFEETNAENTKIVEELDNGQVPDEIEVSESDIYTEDADGNLTFIADSTKDETLPNENDIVEDYEEITEEVNEILAQADDLIAHETPEPVIQPEPIEVTVPETVEDVAEESNKEEEPVQESSEEKETEQTSTDNETVVEEDDSENAPDSSETPAIDESEENTEEPADDEGSVKKKGSAGIWIVSILLSLLALAVIAAGIIFYRNYYLQPIESIVLEDGELGTLTVIVNSEIDENKLSVLCLDMYGNPLTAPVKDGKAIFTGLAPDSAYTIKVNIDGFHRLTGDVFTSFTTPEETNIVQLQAVTGAEDGSVILAFTVEGPDSDLWNVYYSTQNEEEKGQSFSGHMITLTGLSVGSEYTFTLVPETELHVTGTNQVTFTASKIIKANDLAITGCVDGKLTAKWAAPEDVSVENWTVRCYNDKGYDQTLVVNDPSVTFEGVDVAADHTVEVTAAGMSVSERAFAPANSITITQATLDTSNVNQLVLDWDSSAENSWRLLYTVNGSASREINCETETKATIRNIVPGSEYKFSIQATDGSHVLGGDYVYTTPKAEAFSGYGVTADNILFKMCKTPSSKNWDRYDLKSSDYTTEFKVGKKASFLAKMQHEYSVSSDKVVTLYVIRNAEGTIVDASSSTAKWSSMWKKNYGEFNVPSLPDTPGEYTVSIYFDGALVHNQNFTMLS